MQLKTVIHFLFFLFLTLPACSGKNQLTLNPKPEEQVALKGENPSPDAVSPWVNNKSKILLPPPLESSEKSQTKAIGKDLPEDSKVSKKENRKLDPAALPLPSPSFTSTATVSTPAPTPAEPSRPSWKKAGEDQKKLAQTSANNKTLTPQKPGSSSAEDEGVIFNFDNADIHEVINTVSDILGFNYIEDPRLTGVVNVHTKGKIQKKDLFPILKTLLKINNFTIIKKGRFYHITPLPLAKQEYVPPNLSLKKESLPLTDTLVFQIVPLRFISAQEIANIIKPLMSPGADLIMKDNFLILMDFSANIRKLLSLIDLFDVDIFQHLHMKLYEVKNADVEDLTTDLEAVFQAFELSSESAKTGGINLVPITRLNMLLAVSSNETLLEKAVKWARELDTEVSETAIKIFVYYVQNGKAADIADVLNQVFKPRAEQKKKTIFQSKLRERKPSPKGVKTPKPARRIVRPGLKTTGELTGEVDIVVDDVNNALIIRATEKDYRIVEKTIKKLDIYPKQVLIEVLIAEIRLDDEWRMGVEWEYMNAMNNYNYTVKGTGVTNLTEEITSGLKYAVDKTGRFTATLRAFAAKDRVNILSSPHIIASDNKEATINVTEEIPIVSGKVTTTTAEPVITETTEYRDTGIILKVTPHINDKGLVTLDVSQEVSEQSTKAATGSSNPIFLKRSAQTSMVVQDGQTVIIGGLIKESWSKGKSGIPILSNIPVMGSLFGYHKKTANRSELMLLLTPHVITSIKEADLITREFRNKLSIIKKPKEDGKSK